LPNSIKGKLETILVVDDNAMILRVVVAILRNAGFQVLSACNGTKACEMAKKTEGRIDLLLSDVDMPLMSGPDLGLLLKTARPDMHVMLMSGGADGNLLVLNYGWAFIQKPFVSTKLVQMVLNVLHSPDRSQAGGQEFDSRKDTHGRIYRVVTGIKTSWTSSTWRGLTSASTT
jgi:two-component system, cell cycle sensor histidine kinase and response regulator CckA